tara:strand:+ start:2438 stop:3484 length:1047 start_codon:yes stop_codon:yes gene_type:complete
MIHTEFIILVISLFFLVKSSDFLIENIARIAKMLKVSDFVIGLTVVAAGTSLPELASSVAAALSGTTDLIIGNIVGSNIANIALILGATATVAILAIDREVFEREGIFLLFITTIFYIFSFNGKFSYVEGLVFLILFLVYMVYLYEYPYLTKEHKKTILHHTFHFGRLAGKHAFQNVRKALSYNTYIKLLDKNNKNGIHSYAKPVLIIIISFTGIILSAKYLVGSLLNISTELNIATGILGATVLALGTSLPELAVGISAARKRKGDLVLGTILGSNIYNLLIILGISAFITPLTITSMALYYTIPILLLVTVFLVWFIKTNWTLRRFEGILLLIIYILFMFGLGLWV